MATRRTPSEPRRTTDPTSRVGSTESVTAPPPAPRTARRSAEASAGTGVKQAAPTERPRVVAIEVRRGMIAEAAYLRSERRGFAPGYEVEDWLAAEKEIDALLSAAQSVRQ